MADILFSDKNHRVEFHRTDLPLRGLVYTFTPYKFNNLDAPGFGLNLLLADGYDVVAFKCDNDSWYQNLDFSTVQEIGKRSAGYDMVATYGSSMGGYAAILFAKALQAHRVLAISPQFSLKEPFEKRWPFVRNRLIWRHDMTLDSIDQTATYLVMFDDKHAEDLAQIDQLKRVLPPALTTWIGVPFSDHPSLTFLLEMGLVSSVVKHLLRGNGMIALDYKWSRLSRSSAFLFSLGTYARSKGRTRLALKCYTKGLSLAPRNQTYQFALQDLVAEQDRRPLMADEQAV